MSNKYIIIKILFMIILFISIIVSIVFIFRDNKNLPLNGSECPTTCSNGLYCPPGCKTCKTKVPPSPVPGPVDNHFLNKLVSNLISKSINGDSTKSYSDLSGIIIISPNDNIKEKLKFMLTEWHQLTLPKPYYVPGTTNQAIQNAIYPYNMKTTHYDGTQNRQSYNKLYTIIFLPDLSKSNTQYVINDDDGSNLINLFYYSSIYSFQTNTNRVTLIGNIGPNYIPDDPNSDSACGPKSDGSKIAGRKRCGPWSAFVQTGQYLKTNSADNVFFKSINNIDIKINDKESTHNSLIWNTSQMCPIRNINLYADSYDNDNYGSIELGGGVGGFLSDSTIKNIYTSATGQWMASQENFCFKNLKFNKLGSWRGHADAANVAKIPKSGQQGTGGFDYAAGLSFNDRQNPYKLGATSLAYQSQYENDSTQGKTLSPNSCWTRYTKSNYYKHADEHGAADMSNGCPGQFNFCFLNCKKYNGNDIDDDNFLTQGGQRICDAVNSHNKNFQLKAQGYNGATRTNGPNVIEKNENNHNKPYITGNGILHKGRRITDYKIISNDSEFATFFSDDGQIENTIYIVLSNIYNFNKKEYSSIKSFNINKDGITLLGLGFSIVKCKNLKYGINILKDNITLTNLIFDCPDIKSGDNLQSAVINIEGKYCEIYDITVRTVIKCPNSTTSGIEPFPYSSTEDNCMPSVINNIDNPNNVIPVGAATMILVNSDSCYLENIWLWRGDHWNWGGFNENNQKNLDPFNICPFGIIVTRNGTKCEIVQGCIEHHSLSSVVWLGSNGKTLAIQGEIAYNNFGKIDEVGSNFKQLFLPSSISNFSDVSSTNINWNYGIWDDIISKHELLKNNFYNDNQKILDEITDDDKNNLSTNIYSHNYGVYYVIIGKNHVCNGGGFYSLFGIGTEKRFPIYIDTQNQSTITVKNTYITGWANYTDIKNKTMWDNLLLLSDNQPKGDSVNLGDGVYICNIQSIDPLTIFQRKEIVSNSQKGNASLIRLSETQNINIGL